jgi:hypothetical protein
MPRAFKSDEGHLNPLPSLSPLRSPLGYQSYQKMTDLDGALPARGHQRKPLWILVLSYVSDWIVLIAAGLVGTVLGNITPNKRPFRLDDANIA